MSKIDTPMYVPALRMKAGELAGICGLSLDVANKVLPRLVIPPPKERDRQLQQELLRLPDQPAVHGLLSRYWTKPVLLQPGYLLREMESSPQQWLPPLFWNCRENGIEAIPVFSLSEITNNIAAIRGSIDYNSDLQIGVVIGSAEVADSSLSSRVEAALVAINVEPTKCLVLADFSDSHLSDPEIVAPIIRGALDVLQEIARWRLIAFQGTGFPEHNPAVHGKTERIDRTEWLAWKTAVQYDPTTADELLFGDYAADCAKLAFGKGRARAIRHLRYTTGDAWYVVRAKEKGRDAELMSEVSQRIINSSWYDGREYSAADDQIFRMAHRMRGPGTASDWRALNTGHHITRVVRDLGAVKKVFFSTLDANLLEAPQESIPFLISK